MWKCKHQCIPTYLNTIINYPAIISLTCATVSLCRRGYNIEDWPGEMWSGVRGGRAGEKGGWGGGGGVPVAPR